MFLWAVPPFLQSWSASPQTSPFIRSTLHVHPLSILTDRSKKTKQKKTFNVPTSKSSPDPLQPPVCVCVSASGQTKGWSSSSLHLFQSVDGHRGASALSAHYSPRATHSMSRAPPLVQIPQTKRTRSVTLCQYAKHCLDPPQPKKNKPVVP